MVRSHGTFIGSLRSGAHTARTWGQALCRPGPVRDDRALREFLFHSLLSVDDAALRHLAGDEVPHATPRDTQRDAESA